ncbi:hypothetical protein EYF80_038397 [Liparis tanakae]|uniref:Uncharacterized protein n=1 Tax=Liparis tanakae TaxID=230148 RepID=A0A4Z2GFE1_9TELE|nr:hypothetical protein EYF80_038397 [Liparis tanakae]
MGRERNSLFLVSSLFLFRKDVLKPTSSQLQLSESEAGGSWTWEAPAAIRACMRGAYRLAMPLHLYSLSLPVGSSTHCHFWNKGRGKSGTCPGCWQEVWYSAFWHKSFTRWYFGRKFSSWAAISSPLLCGGFLKEQEDGRIKKKQRRGV